jgi:hypothetical protein
MRRAGILLALTLLTGPAWAQEAATNAAVASPAVTLGIQSLPRAKVRALRYSAAKTDDLEFLATVLPHVRGSHQLELRIFTPRGHLYQTLAAPFVVPSRSVRERRTSPKTLVVSARLPVSGTLIMTSSLYGRWRVVPYLDGATEPCGRELRFEITR